MHRYLKKLVDERNSLTGLMQGLSDRAAEEDRDLTEAEAERMRSWQARAAEIDSVATEQSSILESQRAWASLQDKLTAAADDGAEMPRAMGYGTRAPAVQRGASWGEAFINSPQFRAYQGYGSMAPVEVGELFETRAAIDTGFLPTNPAQFVPTLWTMTTPLLDAIGHERVSTGTVEWLKWPGSYPLAGVVAEGDLKPEAVIAPTTDTASLNTYAHWKGITRQALEDLPRIQSIIENALRGGITRKIEADVGTTLTADTDITGVTDPDLLSGIRIALANVQDAGYASANTVLLNPADYAALDLSVMSSTTGGPVSQNAFWGLRPIAVGAITAGTAYVGDFGVGVTLFERNTASVYMSDSHADFFLRNTLVILAETRALPVVTEAQAIQKVTVGTTP